jgi:UDP-4-amino-4,6-dideoxy-N-acetyl-beta-L-altrosamine transaminase
MSIPYTRHTIDEADVAAVVGVLQGDWLTQGPAVAGFEAAIAERCDVPYAVSFSSGTAALHACAFAAGLGPGDELITSAMTFAASANCAAYVGATPRFADIDPGTVNIDPASVGALMNERTRMVVPVHFAGLPAPVAEVRDVVGPDVVLVEDASHALGGGVDGEPVGSCAIADMTVFSLHPAKSIAAGEGGVVTTRNSELHARLAAFRSHGFTKDPGRLTRDEGGWYYEQHTLGFNYRLSDIHAALGASQLSKLDTFVDARIAVAARYRELLADVDGLSLPITEPSGVRHAYHLFVVRVDGAERRRALYDALHARGILAQVHYVPVYWHPWYGERYGYRAGLCPNAEAYYASCLSLPCFPRLTQAQQDEVVDAVMGALA